MADAIFRLWCGGVTESWKGSRSIVRGEAQDQYAASMPRSAEDIVGVVMTVPEATASS